MPIVPRGGRAAPPENAIEPRVGPIKPPKMDRTVDFPALQSHQRCDTHPDPEGLPISA